jgi:hypothetical protein
LVAAQMRRKASPSLYWATIVASTTFGTLQNLQTRSAESFAIRTTLQSWEAFNQAAATDYVAREIADALVALAWSG